MQILIYALPANETREYMEQLISSRCLNSNDVAKVVKAAKQDGWHSFRVAHYDGSAPDFASTLNTPAH